MSASDFMGKTLIEIEKLLDSPMGVDGFTFFLGLIIVDLVINGLLYWDNSISHCKITAGGICKKSLQVFQRIVGTIFYVFSIVLGVKIVGGGIRSYRSLSAKAFLPILAFVISVALFKWLFTDVFQVMDPYVDFSDDETKEGSTILKGEFYRVFNFFDFTLSTAEYVLLGGLVYGLV